jgi:hypothetical protein
MQPQSELVTVFRSADPSAESEATTIRDLLAEAGLSAELWGDDAPGVPAGAYEVRVPAPEVSRAEALIAARESEVAEPGDASDALDLVTVFGSDAHNSEMEAIAIRSILEASGIPAVIVGTSLYPNLPFEVRVPRNQYEAALLAIAESQAAGPQAAEEAERASETQTSERTE